MVVAAMEVHERSKVVIDHQEDVGHEHEIDATRVSEELTGLGTRPGCLV